MAYAQRNHECHWTATRTVGLDAVTITVKGKCKEPTPGYKLILTEFDLPASDSSTLMLVLTVVSSTGTEPQHVTPTPVEFEHTYVVTMKVPSRVMILEAATTIDVKVASSMLLPVV